MLNKATLIGNLGADPETRFLPNGAAVTNISLATTRRWKDKQTDERREATEWHRVIFFNRLAEVAGEYLKKGSQVYVEGRLQTRKWTGQDGVDHYTTEVMASELIMLNSKSGDATQTSSNKQQNQAAKPAQQSGGTYPPPPPLPQQADYDDFDDDIPF